MIALSLLCIRASGAEIDRAPYELPVQVVRLENGLTLVITPHPVAGDVAVEMWFRTGSSDDAPGQHGIAHLFEHMLPPASNLTASAENSAALQRDILDSNGSTGTDYTNMFLRVPAESLELAIAAFADRMSAPPQSISDASLASNREIVVAEFRNSQGRSWDPIVVNATRAILFGSSHPYGHAVLGTIPEVEAISADQMKTWFRSRYNAANTMLVVSGKCDADNVIALAKKYFGSIPAGQTMPLAITPVAPLDRRVTAVVTAPQATPHVLVAWPLPSWRDASRQDVLIAKELFRRQLERTFSCDVYDGDEFAGSAGGETSLRIACGNADRIAAELDHFLTSAPDIAAARDARLASFTESLTRLGWRNSRAQLVGEGLWFAGDARAYLLQLDQIQSATAERVMRAARRWLTNPLIMTVTAALVTDAIDRRLPLSIKEPKPVVATDIVDRHVEGARVITVQRTLPIVIGRVLSATASIQLSAMPARALDELRDAVKGLTRQGLGIIMIGPVDTEKIDELVSSLPAGVSGSATTTPRFTAKSGVTQTTLTVTLHFAATSSARLGVAADLLRTRLNQRIREQERWSYAVNVRTERDGILVSTSVRDEVATKAAAVIREQIDQLPSAVLTSADAERARGSELRRLEILGSVASELADGLVEVIRSGDLYRDYVAQHSALYATLRDGVPLGITAPETVTWNVSGDPTRVDPSLQ